MDDDSARFAAGGSGLFEVTLEDEGVFVRLNDRITDAD